jgi:hypothetical protein
MELLPTHRLIVRIPFTFGVSVVQHPNQPWAQMIQPHVHEV